MLRKLKIPKFHRKDSFNGNGLGISINSKSISINSKSISNGQSNSNSNSNSKNIDFINFDEKRFSDFFKLENHFNSSGKLEFISR